MRTLILEIILKVITPLFLMFALFMLFRGHNSPGGGFIAGLIASIPIILNGMTFGKQKLESKYKIKPLLIATTGLMVALFSGMLSFAFKKPFMTAIWTDSNLLFIGKLGTPLFFDTGIFLLVFGVVTKISYLLLEE